jgi:hypothetical protein
MNMKRATTLLNLLLIALLLISSTGAATTPFKILSTAPAAQQQTTTTVQQLQPVQKLEVASSTAAPETAAPTAPATQPTFTVLQKDTAASAPADSAVIKASATNTAIGTASKTDSPSSSTERSSTPKSLNISVTRQALTRLGVFWGGLSESTPELHFHSKTVTGDTTSGSTFTVSLTAADSDDHVTRISLARTPYAASDFDIRDCPADVYSCTIEFELSEAEPGAYTYMVKAKNARNQIVNDAVTVTVVEDLTADRFNFRTASMDGEKYGRGAIDYVDTEMFVWGDHVWGLRATGTPFATFTVPSNQLMAVEYTADGYYTDRNHIYFDSRLPTCSGGGCTFIAETDEDTYTTTCSLIVYDYHYACTLSNTTGHSQSFDYRAATDPIGPNTIRMYNLIYPQGAPIVDFGETDASFVEGESYTLTLDEYVHDDDTAASSISWTASTPRNLHVEINPSTRQATITQSADDWIGSEMVRFTATDPEGNTGSDYLTVRVLQDDNDAPVIVSKDPDADSANVGRFSSRRFSIHAIDPDYDPLTITWRKGADVVATDTFSYNYVDTDGVPRPLTVVVSDGNEEDAAAWNINIVDPIGTVEGTVTDRDTGLPLEVVHVFLLDAGSMILVEDDYTSSDGEYSMTVPDGTYDLLFTASGYEDLLVADISIYAGETTVQDAELELLPDPIGTVEGTVRDEYTSAAIGGVLVEALSGMTVINSTSTSAAGTYEMELLEGAYDIRFTKMGYKIDTHLDTAVNAGSTTTLDVEMIKWWDDDYGVKYDLTVQSNASWSRNPATRIELTSSNVELSDFQADCGDLRVVDATDEGLVDFYLQTCSPTQIVLYINESVSPTDDITYHIYGNSTFVESTNSVPLDVSSYLDNLWGYWEMDEASSTAGAAAAHGSELKLYSSPPGQSVSIETGRYDGARGELNTTKWFVNDTGVGTWNGDQDVTLLCWSKITDRASTNNPYYMSIFKSPWGSNGFSFDAYYDNSNNQAVCVLENQGAFGSSAYASINVPQDTWHMAACVYNTAANSHFACVNSTCGSAESFSAGGLVSANEVSIGAYDYDGNGLPDAQGRAFTDECGVWRRQAFSTSDVAWFYNDGFGRKYPFHYSLPVYTIGPAIR